MTDHLDHFRARVLQDAMAEATSSYWLRRSATFAAVGNARCDAVAEACRNRAAVSLLQTEVEPDVLAAIREAGAA